MVHGLGRKKGERMKILKNPVIVKSPSGAQYALSKEDFKSLTFVTKTLFPYGKLVDTLEYLTKKESKTEVIEVRRVSGARDS